MSTTTSPLAGQTLAQLAQLGDTPQVRAELNARIARNGKSAPNARKALARLDAGESVAFPPKAPKTVNPNAPERLKRSTTRVNTHKHTPSGLSERDLFAHVANVGRANGYSIPRWITNGSKGRTIRPKV